MPWPKSLSCVGIQRRGLDLNDSEISNALLPAVLRRAAELQNTAEATDAQSTLTLSEILQIGSEVGLDADALRGAAESIDTEPRETSDDCVEVLIPRQLTDAEIADLVSLARKATGEFGDVTEEPGTVVWRASPQKSFFVNFVRESDQTRVQVLASASQNQQAVAILLGSGLGLYAFIGLLVASTGELFGPGGIVLASSALVSVLGWLGLRASINGGRRRLRDLAQHLKLSGGRMKGLPGPEAEDDEDG